MEQEMLAFVYPDPLNPRYITRGVTIARESGKPLTLERISLIELSPHGLYVVYDPQAEFSREGPRETRPGRVLARQRRGRHRRPFDEEVYISYNGIFCAHRGMIYADPSGGANGKSVLLLPDEAACEHYISRFPSLLRDVLAELVVRVDARWLREGPQRTSRHVREEAQSLQELVQTLRKVKVRPLCFSFARVARDLEQAATALHEVAQRRDPGPIAAVKAAVRRAYRGLRIQDIRCRMEDVLCGTAHFYRMRRKPHQATRDKWMEALKLAHRTFTSADTATGELLEEGFARPVLHHVVPHLHLACAYLSKSDRDGGPDIEMVAEELKKACEAL